MTSTRKTVTGMVSSLKQATPEQLRIAQILDRRGKDSSDQLAKVKQIMDATQRSADEVYVALHDSDYDVNRAVDLLIEGGSLADWCTTEKRKKKVAETKEKKGDEGAEQSERHLKNERKLRGTNGDEGDHSRGGKATDQRGPRRPNRDEGNRENTKSRGKTGRGARGRGSRGQRHSLTGETMIFERSNHNELSKPPTSQPAPLIARNQWERPLVCTSRDDEWGVDEYASFLSKTHIFTPSNKIISHEVPVAELQPGQGTAVPPQQPPDAAPRSASVAVERDLQPAESRPFASTAAPAQANIAPFTKLPEEKTPPKHSPTAAMRPPDLKPSLSLLDTQLRTMKLGLNGSGDEPGASLPSQSASSTSLVTERAGAQHQTTNVTSSVSAVNLISHNVPISSASQVLPNGHSPTNWAGSALPQPRVNGSQAQSLPNSSSPTSHNGAHPLQQGFGVTAVSSVETIPTTAMDHIVAGPHTLSTAPPHLVSSATIQQGRFIAHSPFNPPHVPYGAPIMSGHQFDSRIHETNTSVPPPHISHAHLPPPFKQSAGMPKGAFVTNLPPPSSLMSNQYLVGQGSVNYFPPHPFYYYEEVPPVMNSQQRLTSHHLSPGYDGGYQPPTPSNRDGVHYNV